MEYTYKYLMSLGANSNICDRYGSVLSDWLFLLWFMFFSLFACLIIFEWMADIVNFAMLSAGYFCSSVNLLKVFLTMYVSYLEAVWSFWVLLLKFVRKARSSTQTGASFSPLLR